MRRKPSTGRGQRQVPPKIPMAGKTTGLNWKHGTKFYQSTSPNSLSTTTNIKITIPVPSGKNNAGIHKIYTGTWKHPRSCKVTRMRDIAKPRHEQI